MKPGKMSMRPVGKDCKKPRKGERPVSGAGKPVEVLGDVINCEVMSSGGGGG